MPDADFTALFQRLAQSDFRRKFHLGDREWDDLQRRGLPTILAHAADLIQQRLAPAQPQNDGRQTPWRGHPVFIAQHATGTCCRGCLQRWHDIASGRSLTSTEQAYIVAVIQHWLQQEIQRRASV